MLIGELAERAGVTTRMVRHYANAGLVPDIRDANGYRDFHPRDVTRVRQIQSLVGLGLTVTQVSSLLPCLGEDPAPPSCPAARKALEQRLNSIDAQVDDLTALRQRILANLAPHPS
ncbi:MerR family transcriptional regulator [Nocardia acidivorans]|uniref:MerR family transcriptional regulator n=1 Tax=Nocardia acidivorans TaxID=404580 RepID=UPI0008351BBA|nr:MerR family transcriptional regulator [Nocardia acidivorans]